MSLSKNLSQAIPTNIISGFLGSGKTTTILELVKQKPAHERWAILVNEFGEIGIDGAHLQGSFNEKDGIFINEVPGGCMCCSVTLMMQVTLNKLLLRAKPHRVLIEPTGLGHPQGLIEVLTSQYYEKVLDIKKSITLVDARKLTDHRYINHDTFIQQIDLADIVIANKVDLYQANEHQLLQNYLQGRSTRAIDIIFTEHGKINREILDGPSSSISNLSETNQYAHHHEHHHHEHGHNHGTTPEFIEDLLPECGYLKKVNSGEGFESVGWRFSPDITFNFNRLSHWIEDVKVERLKAVIATNQGIISFNKAEEIVNHSNLNTIGESKIEIIADSINPLWESQLMDCKLN